MSKKNKMNSYLVFYLENELFTIHVNKIISILEMKKITKIPESPDYMKGVINLRGKVLPIIDSHIKFNLPPISISMKTSIIVLEIKTKEKKIKLGLMVDKVEEVIQISKNEILPPPNIGDAFQSEYIKGMYKKDDKNFIMIIDIDKVLSLKEIVDLGDLNHKNIEKALDKTKIDDTEINKRTEEDLKEDNKLEIEEKKADETTIVEDKPKTETKTKRTIKKPRAKAKKLIPKAEVNKDKEIDEDKKDDKVK